MSHYPLQHHFYIVYTDPRPLALNPSPKKRKEIQMFLFDYIEQYWVDFLIGILGRREQQHIDFDRVSLHIHVLLGGVGLKYRESGVWDAGYTRPGSWSIRIRSLYRLR